jgi:hypothetical protein
LNFAAILNFQEKYFFIKDYQLKNIKKH